MRREMTVAVHPRPDRLTGQAERCYDHPGRIWCRRDGKRLAWNARWSEKCLAHVRRDGSVGKRRTRSAGRLAELVLRTQKTPWRKVNDCEPARPSVHTGG